MINDIGAAFGGSGVYFYAMAVTNVDLKTDFGEARPGASAGTTFARAIGDSRTVPGG